MSTYQTPTSQPTFQILLDTFACSHDRPFGDGIDKQTFEHFAHKHDVHFGQNPDNVYPPPVTLWAWLTQVLCGVQNTTAAVSRVLLLRWLLGLPPCSTGNSGYCKARAKIPTAFVQDLAYHTAETLEDAAPEHWRWHGRRVLLGDGTDIDLPDTAENQAEYPQPETQNKDLGFPKMRLVVLLTFATAAIIGAAVGPWQGKGTGETALLLDLLDRFREGDVFVADRCYCSYWIVALLGRRGVDVVMRMHAQRKYDFRRGKKLGREDHVVTWSKPVRPEWMDQKTYNSLPETLEMRELRFRVENPGYRSEEIVVATTLVDAQEYAKNDIADLYGRRWMVELDIRSIKQTLGMDVLDCQTPEMARRELWVYVLGYNLIRRVMAQAALAHGKSPRSLSFANARSTLETFRESLMRSDGAEKDRLLAELAKAISRHKVGHRGGRSEPRKIKRTPKRYKRLRVAREQWHRLYGCSGGGRGGRGSCPVDSSRQRE